MFTLIKTSKGDSEAKKRSQAPQTAGKAEKGRGCRERET